MKHLLLTGYDESYAPLAELTVPLMESFAAKRGFDFFAARQSLIDVPLGIYWTGIVGTLKAFSDGYDLVLYLDVDQMVTNPMAPLIMHLDGFEASRDWGEDAVDYSHFSMCGFTAASDTKFIFEAVLALEPEWRDKPFPAQAPLQHVYRTMPEAKRMMRTAPRKKFNAVPDEVCPGKVVDPWQPGDTFAHLTNLPLPERVALFQKIKEQAGL